MEFKTGDHTTMMVSMVSILHKLYCTVPKSVFINIYPYLVPYSSIAPCIVFDNQLWWASTWVHLHSGLTLQLQLLLLQCFIVWKNRINGHIVRLELKLPHLLFICTIVIWHGEVPLHLPREHSEHLYVRLPRTSQRPNNTVGPH